MLQAGTNAFLSQVSSFDPLGQQQGADVSNTLTALINNDNTEIKIFF